MGLTWLVRVEVRREPPAIVVRHEKKNHCAGSRGVVGVVRWSGGWISKKFRSLIGWLFIYINGVLSQEHHLYTYSSTIPGTRQKDNLVWG